MIFKQFRFDFKGKKGSSDNTDHTRQHPSPDEGEVTIGISGEEPKEKRDEAINTIRRLSEAINKKSVVYHWDYHDAILIRTERFDVELGILMTYSVEEKGALPSGSTIKLKNKLRNEGHAFVEDNISLVKNPAASQAKNASVLAEPEKKTIHNKLLRFFRIGKRGRSR